MNKTEYNKLYRKKNRDKLIAYSREYYKKYYAENREKILEKCKKYRDENPDKHKLFRDNWYKSNKDKRAIKIKEWRDKNKEKTKTYTRISHYKRRKQMLDTDINKEWLLELFMNTKFCCICKVELSDNGRDYPNGKHLDHIKPLAVGGSHTKDNVRFICVKCNVSRPKDGSDVLNGN